jgi:hypothetical protein
VESGRSPITTKKLREFAYKLLDFTYTRELDELRRDLKSATDQMRKLETLSTKS